MIYKVGLLGASGRMGQEIAALLAPGYPLNADTFELADGITQSGRLRSIEGLQLRQMDDPPREPVHVWVDFSRPAATVQLLKRIDCPIVIGTTGFSEGDLALIQAYAQKHPVLLCPNTSPGMRIMRRMLLQTAGLGTLGVEAVLEEEHHRHKKDSPSGTAKRLLETLKAAGFESVPVHVTRAGTLVGNHRVRFIGEGEELLVEHRVTDRRVFAKGALLAAAFLLQCKEPRLYLFDELT